MLLEDRARVMRHVDFVDEVVVHVAEPGFWFGELGLLGDLPNAVTVVAAQSSKALVLPTRRFNEIVDVRPGFYREFTRLALERYAIVIGFAAESAAMPAEARLRRRLATLAHLRRIEVQDTSRCVLNVSQLELANMISVSRQRLNQMLKDLESQHLIALPARRIETLDLPGLQVPIAGRATF